MLPSALAMSARFSVTICLSSAYLDGSELGPQVREVKRPGIGVSHAVAVHHGHPPASVSEAHLTPRFSRLRAAVQSHAADPAGEPVAVNIRSKLQRMFCLHFVGMFPGAGRAVRD